MEQDPSASPREPSSPETTPTGKGLLPPYAWRPGQDEPLVQDALDGVAQHLPLLELGRLAVTCRRWRGILDRRLREEQDRLVALALRGCGSVTRAQLAILVLFLRRFASKLELDTGDPFHVREDVSYTLDPDGKGWYGCGPRGWIEITHERNRSFHELRVDLPCVPASEYITCRFKIYLNWPSTNCHPTFEWSRQVPGFDCEWFQGLMLLLWRQRKPRIGPAGETLQGLPRPAFWMSELQGQGFWVPVRAAMSRT